MIKFRRSQLRLQILYYYLNYKKRVHVYRVHIYFFKKYNEGRDIFFYYIKKM